MNVLWKRNWIATLVMVNLLLTFFLVAASVTNAGPYVGTAVMTQNIYFEGQLTPDTVLQPLSVPDVDPTILGRRSFLLTDATIVNYSPDKHARVALYGMEGGRRACCNIVLLGPMETIHLCFGRGHFIKPTRPPIDGGWAVASQVVASYSVIGGEPEDGDVVEIKVNAWMLLRWWLPW